MSPSAKLACVELKQVALHGAVCVQFAATQRRTGTAASRIDKLLRSMSARITGLASGQRRAIDVRAVNTSAYDGGLRRSVASWISGPKEILTFIPRLSTGALLMGPSLLSELNIGLQQVNTLMNDTVMTDDEKRVCGPP